MPEQMSFRLDDRLAARVREAAAEDGCSATDWVRGAMRHRLALRTALRARAKEDRRGGLYTDEQEDSLLDARARESATDFERHR